MVKVDVQVLIHGEAGRTRTGGQHLSRTEHYGKDPYMDCYLITIRVSLSYEIIKTKIIQLFLPVALLINTLA